MTLTQVIIAIVGTGALLSLATFLLPRHVTVTRSATVSAAAADVMALASSNEGYQRFNPYRATDPNLRIELFGPPMGVGSGFRFDGKEGKGSQIVTGLSSNQVDFEIDLGAMGKPRQSLQAIASGSGTKVVWTMQMDMGMNPAARVFGLFMDGMIGKTFETGLRNLATATAK